MRGENFELPDDLPRVHPEPHHRGHGRIGLHLAAEAEAAHPGLQDLAGHAGDAHPGNIWQQRFY